MNWSTSHPKKDGFYIVSLNNGNVGIACFIKFLQGTTNSPLKENIWNTSVPVKAYKEIPEHYLNNKIGWNFSFDGENLPSERGQYLVSVIEQKSYGQVQRVEMMFYEAKKDQWYCLAQGADVVAWRKLPKPYKKGA